MDRADGTRYLFSVSYHGLKSVVTICIEPMALDVPEGGELSFQVFS